jgi:hypothetical protein
MANFPSPPKALRFLAAPNSITFAPPVGHVSVYVTTFDPGFPITLRAFDPDGNELASSTVANPPRPSGYSGFVPVAVEVGDNQIASVRVDGQLLPDNTTFTVIDDLSYRRWGSLYAFDGFFQPVDNGTVNKVNAGSAVPVKFSLGGDFGLDVLAAGSPTSAAYTCDGSAQDVIEQTVTASTSSLSFKAGTNQYVYVWKTEKVWANTCRVFTLTLADNSTHTARFRFTR